jgi:putative membrane protein
VSAPFTVFPAINATLNGASAVLLLAGRRLIAQRKIQQHRAVMISAVITSSLFLACYLTYHALLQIYAHGAITRFQGTGLSRPIYFSILLSHTILAVVTVPLVLITLHRGLNARFDKHRAIARWTFPIWLYVSVTGVVIYFMLYQWFAA